MPSLQEPEIVITRPSRPARKHTLSELIDLDTLASNAMIESPSGDLLTREEFFQRPDRPASIRERQERIRMNVFARLGSSALRDSAETASKEVVPSTKKKRQQQLQQHTCEVGVTINSSCRYTYTTTLSPNFLFFDTTPHMATTRFPCSFEGCSEHFESTKELRAHKITNPDHYYCKKCDVDCLDWLDLTQHKVDVMTPFLLNKMPRDAVIKHIVCEFCGEDFKSWGGREAHRQTMHRAEQSVTCPGCASLFVGAGMMIEHIERDRCGVISAQEFKSSVQKKYIIHEVMRDPEPVLHTLGRIGPNAVVSGAPSLQSTGGDNDSDDGGISLLDSDTGHSGFTTPKILEASSGHQGTVWPALSAVTTGERSLSISAGNDTSSPHAASVLPASHANMKPSLWTATNTSKTLFPEAKPTPVSEEVLLGSLPPPAFDLGLSDATGLSFSADRFFDKVIQRFVCPFPQCASLGYNTAQEIERHFNYGHTKEIYQCPACLKRFKLIASLVGHIETTNKCRIRKAHQFAMIVDEITGGYLSAMSVKQEKLYYPSNSVVRAGDAGDGVIEARFKGKLPSELQPVKW